MKIALLLALGACSTAAADPAPPTFVKIGRCPNGGYMVDFNCAEFLTTPGLPAVDATGKQVVVPSRTDSGLSTLPNLAVWVLSTTDGRKLDTLPMWSQADSMGFAKKLEGKPSPQDISAVTRAIDAKRVKLESSLAGYRPIPHCTRGAIDGDPGARMTACGGTDHWKCGDIDLDYAKSHAQLKLTSGGASTTVDTRPWRLPPVEIHGGEPMKIPTLNCIVDAARIPNTGKIVIELAHVCDEGGDWCYVGGNTFQIVNR
jgi:hypothetical protein